MVAKGGPNDGESYYAPMLAHRVHEEPERTMELPPVAGRKRTRGAETRALLGVPRCNFIKKRAA